MAGIIPAYAGSTALSSPTLIVVRGSSPRTRGARRSNVYKVAIGGDHPRVRGEHPALAAFDDDEIGIIPAYAGSTPVIIGKTCTVAWIIPAYAGSTPSIHNHPLVRLGSSPRTRGALLDEEFNSGLFGDHPRVRGEHLIV